MSNTHEATDTAPASKESGKPRLVASLAQKFGVDPDKMLSTLKATAFRQQKGEVSNEQMMALLVVANEYNLNPFTKELYAYPDKQNGIVPVVSLDGWARIINERPQLRGIEFRASEEFDTPPGGKPCPTWMEVAIHRSDRDHPIVIREYLDEVYRAPFEGKRDDGSKYTVNGPWQSHTKRMLRHKTLIQGARIAFGFGGIYDDDEAQRINERNITAESEIVGRSTDVTVTRKSESATTLSGSADAGIVVMNNAAALTGGTPTDITAASLIARLAEVKDRDAYDEVQSLAYDVLKGDGLRDYKRAAAVKFAEIAQDV